jgi:transposase
MIGLLFASGASSSSSSPSSSHGNHATKWHLVTRLLGLPLIADAGHESRKLARTLKQHQGWQLRIVKRRQRAFKITGLTWIVERSFAWLGRNRRLSKDYEYRVQTSETMIDLAAIRLMLNRIALA